MSIGGSDDFYVIGEALELKTLVNQPPRLRTRRIYNAPYFYDESYHHEIANHYRDYKHKQPPGIRRRRRRRNVYTQICPTSKGRSRSTFDKGAVIKEQFVNASTLAVAEFRRGDGRDLWPVTVQNYPRFAIVHAPRGRQTLCETRPPDEIYNFAVRRIKSATSLHDLKLLAAKTLQQQQQQEQKLQQRHHHTRPFLTSCNDNIKRTLKPIALTTTAAKSTAGIAFVPRQQENVTGVRTIVVEGAVAYERRPLKWWRSGQAGYQQVQPTKWYHQQCTYDNRSHTDACQLTVSKFNHNCNLNRCSTTSQRNKVIGSSLHQTKRSTESKANTSACIVDEGNSDEGESEGRLPYYLKLATEYYEEGFLKNLEYLKSIGTRNAIRQQAIPPNRKHQYKSKSNEQLSKSSAATAHTLSGDKVITISGKTTARVKASAILDERQRERKSKEEEQEQREGPLYRVNKKQQKAQRFAALLQRIEHNKRVGVGISITRPEPEATKAECAEDPCGNNITNYCAIRVNITPTITPLARSTTCTVNNENKIKTASAVTKGQSETASTKDHSKDQRSQLSITASSCSMNVQSHETQSYTQTTLVKNDSQTAAAVQIAETQTAWHEMVEGLTKLEIETNKQLPKIKLTDCSVTRQKLQPQLQ